MNKFVSPLRYPGGKLKVVNYIKRLMEENDLCGGTYIEPYAGGANVALSLLLSKYAKRIIINDIDRSIYAFWHSALMETENLCRMIQDTDVTLETWERQHELQKKQNGSRPVGTGFQHFFLKQN